MDTAASIIAFVTLTLATVKSCHDLLSAVRDGPEKLNHVNTAISTLVSAFEQIKTEPDLKTVCSSASLRTITENCKADFERFKARLDKVEILPHERRYGKLWKRLKLAFTEKDLPWILAVVNGHVDAVTMELNIIQFRSLNRVEKSTSRILAQQETHSVRIEEQLTNLDYVRNHASVAAEHGAHVRDAVQALTQKMMAMSSASEEQASTMSEMLRRIEEEITKMRASPATEPAELPFDKPIGAPFIQCTASDSTPGAVADSALKESMSRLSNLVVNVECTMESDDAMEIIDDLDTLLRTASKWNREIDSTSCSCAAQHDKPGLDIQELRGQFLKAKSVQINKALTRTTVPGFSVTRRKRSYTEHKGPGGILRFQRQHRIFDRDGPQRATFSDERNIATWMPTDLESPISITISHYERVVGGMVSSLPPSLVISPVLELGHPVFDTVRHGQVDDLRRLLSEKKAWLRARDPYGASLLHYATQNISVMEFLILNGADVDDFAHYYGVSGVEGYLTSPLSLSVIELVDNSACFKRLLAAGADPFLYSRDISTGIEQGTAIGRAATNGHTYIRAAADEIANTYDAFGILAAGPELLHRSTWNYRLGNMRILVIQEHSASKNTNLYSLKLGAGFLDTAIYLIENGINLEPNANGVTPGQYAYHLALESDCSSVGDCWDRALAMCGLDVEEPRVDHPRVGRYKLKDRYNHTYTLSDFMEMWDGYESLCPYYEEAIADSAAYECQTIDWSRVCTDETCPYYGGMRAGSVYLDSEDSFYSSSEDSSEDGGVIVDSTPWDTSEDSELLQDRS